MTTPQSIPANSCTSCTHLVRKPTLGADTSAARMASQNMYNCVLSPQWEFFGRGSHCSFTPSRHQPAVSKAKPSGATS
jgi:hypothetical protein